MEFRILGPLEVADKGELIAVGSPRQQATLAMLILEADNVVPIDRLVNALWDYEPPRTVRSQVHICISTLRRTLTERGGLDLISTRKPGYILTMGDCALDMRAFDDGVAIARRLLADADPVGAVAEFRRVLSLWRGPALSGINGQLIQQSVLHLNERRLAVLEECMEAELRAGRYQDLVAELIKVRQEHPLRERFSALLMLALYQSGRQAEALAAYRATSRVLRDELGIEPGRDLRELHAAILAGQLPANVAAQRRPEPVVAVVPQNPEGPRTAVPMLLPAAITDFTGRAALVDRIVASLHHEWSDGQTPLAVPIAVISGPPGLGKTTLAVQVAHQAAAAFPDGQLFARLRLGSQATDPADILERFLRALGIVGSSVPDELEERAEMFRDLLGKRRMMIVLDDAMSEQQVSHLLPGNPRCAVIVTSRRRLTGLSVTDRWEIDPFDMDSAVKLFTRVLGGARIGAEPEAVAALCKLCGNMPLSLRIVAAQLAARPHWSIAAMVERLLDESRRLDVLSYGELGVRASIALSYAGLSVGARRLLRRLALCEAPSFASWVASPLLGLDTHRAEEFLDELTEAYFLDTEHSVAGGRVRYRFHDIMRLFARERLLDEEAPDERRAALERLAGTLLFMAGEAHRREYCGNYLPVGNAGRWQLPGPLIDHLLENPLDWYEQERVSLLAAIRQAAVTGLVEHCWELALATVTLFKAHSYFTDWRETHEIALKAACGAGDRRGEAAMHYSLGLLDMFQQQNGQAAWQLTRARGLYDALGDRYGAALVLQSLAILDCRNGNLERAIARWEDALEMVQVLGDQVAEAHVLYSIAMVRISCDDDCTAQELLDRAAEICQETGNRRVGAQVQNCLGEIFRRAVEFGVARRSFAEC